MCTIIWSVLISPTELAEWIQKVSDFSMCQSIASLKKCFLWFFHQPSALQITYWSCQSSKMIFKEILPLLVIHMLRDFPLLTFAKENFPLTRILLFYLSSPSKVSCSWVWRVWSFYWKISLPQKVKMLQWSRWKHRR